MTPKEKANKLVNKFYNTIYLDMDYEQAKYSALIAISELIKENLRYDYIPFEGSRTEFYLQVEKELNKL